MPCLQDADNTFGPQFCGRFDFTLLFEQSCLQIIPCALLLLLLPVRLPQLYTQSVKITTNLIPSLKIAAICMLAGTQLALLVSWSTRPSFRTQASIPAAALSFAASLALLLLSSLEHTRSIRPSSIINIYILFSLLLDIPQARTLWIRQVPVALPALFTVSVVAKVFIIVLEARGKQRVLARPYRLYAPELLVNIYDRTALWWLNPLFFRGYTGRIAYEGLYMIDDDLAAEKLERTSYRLWHNGSTSSRLRLLRITFRTVLRTTLGVFAARICLGALRLSQPLLIWQVTLWLSAEERSTERGKGLIVATALLYVGLSITNVTFKRGLDRLTTKGRAILISFLHSKTLSLPSEQSDDGAVSSFLTADVNLIIAAIPEVVDLLVAPLEIGAAIFLLQRQLGLSCIAPVALVVPVSLGGFLGSAKAMPSQAEWLTALQSRIAYTAAALGASKTFKMLGLTDNLIERIQSLRVEELSKCATFRKFVAVRNVVAFIPDEFASPLTLMMFSLLNGGRALTPAVAFTSLALVQLLVRPIHLSIQAVPACMNAIASFGRIESFLLRVTDHWELFEVMDDTPASAPTESKSGVALSTIRASDGSKRPLVELEHVTVRLGKEEKLVLDNLSLAIAPQTFTVIVGPVGCGKSTLLRTLIGDVPCTGQRIVANGQPEFAYCSQDAWLTNETIRMIILGVSEYEEEWYQSTIRTCALQHDLDSFPLGDSTIVGSKGISLSGGQRQRIALARALYARKELLVMDDALSGIDTRTSSRILTNLSAICRRNRTTLIFATHSVQHLHYADKIVVLGSGGQIVDQGSLELLSTRDGYVRDLEISVNKSDEPEDPDAVHDILSKRPILVSAEVESEERLDLARRTGDIAVYKHYAASIGWKLGSVILLTAALSSFGETFAGVVVRWWSEDELLPVPPHPIGFWIPMHFATGFVALLSFFVFLWVFLVWTVPRSSASLHLQLLQSALKAPYSFFVSIDTGVMLNYFATDMSLIETQLAGNVIRTLTGSAACIGSAILIAAGTAYTGVTMPFVILVLFGLQKFYLRTSRQLRLMELEAQAPLLTHCQETQMGITTIRAMGWQRHSHRKCITLLDQSQRPYYLLLCAQRWLNLVLDLVTGAIATIVVALAVTTSQTASAGSIGLSLLNIIGFNTQLSELIVAWTALETALGAVARCRNFTRSTPSEHLVGEETQPPAAWPDKGSIQLSDLSAAYTSGGEAVLKNITLTIPAGTKVGICGRSGSGKSSLLLTLVRMLDPSSGQILVDDVDLAALPREVIRRRFATIPQEGFCLPGSVRANLDPTHEFADSQLLSVLAQVHLSSRIDSRGSLDAELSGLSLSQGEMQLFAVARALLRPSRLLLVDEMTSAVDRATEQRLLEVISAAFCHSTIIAVAHRLQTIVDFDLVVVMDSGSVVEVGAPRELLTQSNGLFRKMWETGR